MKSFVFLKENNVVVDWAAPRGTEDEECGVYMTNIKEDVEEKAVRDHFGKFGVIEKVRRGTQAVVFWDNRRHRGGDRKEARLLYWGRFGVIEEVKEKTQAIFSARARDRG